MRKKWIVLATLVVLCIAFSLLYPKQNVFKRAIVVGIAIDYVEDEYEITIEYLKEKKYIVHSTKASNIRKGLDKITKEIGLKVSMSQCTTIILQKSQSIYTILLELTKMEQLSTNTVIASSDEAKELLKSQIEVEDSVSGLIFNVLQKNEDKKVLKDVLIAYKTKRPIEITGLKIQNKSLYQESNLILDFNNISIQ